MFGWAPGTAEQLPSPDLNRYHRLAYTRVESEGAVNMVQDFLGTKQDDTARAQKMLKERGDKFRLTDLVLPPWQQTQ